ALRLSKRPKFKTDDEVISLINDILRATLIKRSRKKIFKARRLPKRVIDPACGSGGFCGGILGYLEDRIDKSQFLETNLFACHVDQFAVSTAKTFIDLLLPGRQEVFNIFHHNGLCSDRVHSWEKDDLGDVIAEESFDLIISNPPGGADYNLGYDDELRSNFPLEKHKKGNLQNAPLFIQRAIQLARDGGKICLIVPDGTLANVQLQYLHKHIFDTCRVKAVVSLPRGIFPNVPSKMSILYMIKDKKPEVKEPIFMAEVKTGTESETGEEYNLESELEEILREFRMFHKN
ncbi:MAG: class I SAM-dependent DNA methyltransferase, partial [bacterium]